MNTNSAFQKKNSINYSSFNTSLKKTFMVSNDCPLKISSIGSTMNITTNK